MATLRVTLTLSSASVLASPVNVSADFSGAADSGILSRAKVVKTAVHANALEVYTANDKTESAYLFLKNLETEKEQYVYIYNDTDSDGLVAKVWVALSFVLSPLQWISHTEYTAPKWIRWWSSVCSDWTALLQDHSTKTNN